MNVFWNVRKLLSVVNVPVSSAVQESSRPVLSAPRCRTQRPIGRGRRECVTDQLCSVRPQQLGSIFDKHPGSVSLGQR